MTGLEDGKPRVYIRIDVNGVPVKIGDTVHCWYGKPDEGGSSMRGVVNEIDGAIYVADNSMAIVCAEFVEII